MSSAHKRTQPTLRARRWPSLSALVVLAATTGVLACGGDSGRGDPGPAAVDPPAPAALAATASRGMYSRLRFFSPTSFWNAPLPADAPIDPSSSTLVDTLLSLVDGESAAKTGPWMSTTGFSTPIYIVGRHAPTVRVKLDNRNPALQLAFAAVPLPAGARPAAGTDEQLTIWQPSTDRLWEFWKMAHRADGWHAQWGGAMEHVSKSPGYFTRRAWRGARSNWGASATSLPLVGGLVTLADVREGRIEHALAMGLPEVRAGVWRWPAQRSDGTSGNPSAIPEGTRFRIEPKLDIAALKLPPLVQMLALAAQRYGIIVRDKSGIVDFYGQDPTPTGTNPYTALLGEEFLWQQLAKFPWEHLQVVSPTQR